MFPWVPNTMHPNILSHLPASRKECLERGWQEVDIVLVTGDAYVDHPSFGVALIGRLLEARGYRVAILAQPRFDRPDDFRRFGQPRLFFGITAGNLDSIVANYSGSGKVRDFDAYSKDGNPYRSQTKSKSNRLRPDRASIVYANLARSAFPDTTVILGGVEASLRRFVHFDYKQNRLRGSVLTDAKADILVYGMGENAVLEIAERAARRASFENIDGTCLRLTDRQFQECYASAPPDVFVLLPAWEEIHQQRKLFLEAELCIDRHARAGSRELLAQRQQSGWILQQPAARTLGEEELDQLYNLPFTRTPHPQAGHIPAQQMIRHSITVVRGCCGNCSFCAITRHQGPQIVSRSLPSVVEEVHRISRMDDFSGTISDLGGPTANLYGSSCRIGGCRRHDCLYPKICEHLRLDEVRTLALLENVSTIEGVRHVFISSGLRMELLLKTPKLLKALLFKHTPGSLKIAPEHTDDNVLRLMHKEKHLVLERFVEYCRRISSGGKNHLQLTPYIITGHPGSSAKSAASCAASLKKLGLVARQFQDFTPTPGTLSTAMFVSGLDRSGKKIHLPSPSERIRQRTIFEETFHRRQQKKKKT